MTSKLVVNTIEADTGISSVSFASSISMSSTSKFHFSNAGIDIGADTNINRPAAGVLGFNINGTERARIVSDGKVGIGTVNPSKLLDVQGHAGSGAQTTIRSKSTAANASNFVRSESSDDKYIGLLKYGTGHSAYGALPSGGGAVYANSSVPITIMSDGGYINFATGGNTERLRITSDGRLLLGSGAIATPKITGPGGLDVSQYGLSICMGGSSGSSGQARANATTKEARLVIPHYTNAEEPLTAIAAFSTSSYNYINYGGGTSLGNVATRHQFYTAANTTTTGGSEKLKIEHSGVRSFATFVDTSYHANPDPFGDGSGIVYYRLNDNFHDSGIFAQHGTSRQGGDPTFAFQNSSGERCWNNPADGAINIPNLKNSYPFTMAAWINLSSWPTSSNNDLIMNLSIGGQRVSLCIVCWGGTNYSDLSIMYGGTSHWTFAATSRPTNQWIHVVYSVVGSNNSSHAVYQNGTALSATNRGGGHGGAAGWAIGGNAANSERFSIGRIGSIRFFNKAISSSEASALYTNDTFYT